MLNNLCTSFFKKKLFEYLIIIITLIQFFVYQTLKTSNSKSFIEKMETFMKNKSFSIE